jgi:hypothetical protein
LALSKPSYKRAETLANSLSCSTSDAILVLAQKNGINLKKHGSNLTQDKLREIRELASHAQAAPATTMLASPSPSGHRGKPKPKKSFRVKVQAGEDDPILSPTTHDEMEAMVPVYKTLYTLENSIRQFINRVLSAKHGSDWWDRLAPRGLKETVAKRMKEESANAWHQKRSSNPVYYLDLDQLPPLIRQSQVDFVPTFFKSAEWFQHFVDEVYQSRCVVCHMNPLIQNNVDGVGIRFNQWENLLKSKIGDVKALEPKVPSAAEAVVTRAEEELAQSASDIASAGPEPSSMDPPKTPAS